MYLFSCNLKKPTTNMEAKEILLHCLIFFLILAMGILLYQVRKYLNSKPLGMQTVLDDLAKDGIILLQLALILNWISWLKVTKVYNYYAALTMVNTAMFLRMALVTQLATFSIIRYLFVFHFPFINSMNEKRVRTISRTCVTILAILDVVFTDFTATKRFLYLTENKTKFQSAHYKNVIPPLLIGCISLSTIIFVQARIVYIKWKSPNPPPQVNDHETESYNLKTITLAVFFVASGIIFAISNAFVKTQLLRRIMNLFGLYIFILIVIMLLIKSNDQMYTYVKKKLFPEKLITFLLFLFSSSTNNDTPMSPSNEPQPTEPNSTESQNPFVVPLPLHISSNERCSSSTPIIVNSSSQFMNMSVNRPQNSFLPDVSV